MHVVQVINSLDTGGAEKLLHDSIPYYLARNVKITLVLLKRTASPFLQHLEEQCPEVQIVTLSNGSVYNPFLVFKLNKHLTKGADLVHVHLFPALYWTAMAKMFSSSKIKMVFTEHNRFNRRRNKFFFKPWDRLCYSKYDRIIAVSEDVEKVLRDYLKYSKERIRIIPNGVAIEEVETARATSVSYLGISEEDSIILQVSSFTAQKDQKTLIVAVSQMNPMPHLLLVGSGPTQESCRRLSSDLGISENIHFLNTRMDVWPLMKAADIIVLSTHFEGLSLTSIEAMASGTPFVASEVPGVSELVKDAGLLFPEGDAEELKITLEGLLNDEDLQHTVIQNCKARASQYHIKRTVDKHIALYQELCPNPS